MSDFDIDPERVATQASRLHDLQAGPAGLPDVWPPDTGETSSHTSAVLRRLGEVRDDLATGLAELASDVEQCLAVYDRADGEAGFILEQVMRAVLS